MSGTNNNRTRQQFSLSTRQLYNTQRPRRESQSDSSTPSTPSDTRQHFAASSMLRLHQGGIQIPPAPPNIQVGESTDDDYHRNNETDSSDTVNAIANIIDVCNDVDKESYCQNTELAVKRCIRQHLWANNKFLTDLSLKNMNVSDRTNTHSIINILLKFTRREKMSDVHRFRFWKKYGPMVQKELNTMKTIATRSIRTALMPGKQYSVQIQRYFKLWLTKS